MVDKKINSLTQGKIPSWIKSGQINITIICETCHCLYWECWTGFVLYQFYLNNQPNFIFQIPFFRKRWKTGHRQYSQVLSVKVDILSPFENQIIQDSTYIRWYLYSVFTSTIFILAFLKHENNEISRWEKILSFKAYHFSFRIRNSFWCQSQSSCPILMPNFKLYP